MEFNGRERFGFFRKDAEESGKLESCADAKSVRLRKRKQSGVNDGGEI